MARISATIRITIGLALLAVTALLAADSLGLVPDARRAAVEGRVALSESVAVHCSTLVGLGNIEGAEAGLKTLVARNDDVLSAALRREDGSILVEAGNHSGAWEPLTGGHSTDSQMMVPIYSGHKPWGAVEVRFKPIIQAGWGEWLGHPLIRLVAFFAIGCFGVFFFYLRKMLQHLDPSKVIPDRVREALDALAEGLVVIDQKERIVLANQAFATRVDECPKKLQGTALRRLPWKTDGDEGQAASPTHPWSRAISSGEPQLGQMLRLANDRQEFVLLVNATPVLNEEKKGARGALVTFEDVTPLREKQAELVRSLAMLNASREEVRRQNEELKILATSDPLTQCLNRRSFFERFEKCWNKAQARDDELAVVMIDIDHFKSFNDNYGHAFGDRVLKHVSSVLRDRLQTDQLVCRFGGEEFCVLMPNASIEQAAQIAESLRREIEQQRVDDACVTASMGVSSRKDGAGTTEELLEQADKSLYVSKRSGRNRVTLWGDVPDDVEIADSPPSRNGPDAVESAPISAEGVAALVSTLNYRDPQTAEHSRRVADLAVAAAAVDGRMSVSDVRLLEIAALLHDVGKIGVPDSILLKATPLSDEEWEIMNSYGVIGVEIVHAAFRNDELTRVLETYRAWFGGDPAHPDLPRREEIPLSARLIAIADAFDSMVSDRVYRAGVPMEQAIAELRQGAGSQFDPELVEIFVSTLKPQSPSSRRHEQDCHPPAFTELRSSIERLADACKRRDLATVNALAGRLARMADKQGIAVIAEKAAVLESLVHKEPDLVRVVSLTCELLDICRTMPEELMATRRDEP